eukprot:scaffold763_cov73-Isochrysis_galbana.AAC.1
MHRRRGRQRRGWLHGSIPAGAQTVVPAAPVGKTAAVGMAKAAGKGKAGTEPGGARRPVCRMPAVAAPRLPMHPTATVFLPLHTRRWQQTRSPTPPPVSGRHRTRAPPTPPTAAGGLACDPSGASPHPRACPATAAQAQTNGVNTDPAGSSCEGPHDSSP